MPKTVSPTVEKLLTYENDADRITVALAEGFRDLLSFVAWTVAGSIAFSLGMAVGLEEPQYDFGAGTYVSEDNPLAVGLVVIGGLVSLIGVIFLFQGVTKLRGRLADLRTAAVERRNRSQSEPTDGTPPDPA